MASTAIAVDERQRLISLGWIINRKDDLIWFIGSVVTSYAFLAANLILIKLGLSVMIVTWIWALGFDGPHVFGTVSRTYADAEERRKRAKLYYGTLAVLAGPCDGAGGSIETAWHGSLGTFVFLLRICVGVLSSCKATLRVHD